MVIGALSDIFWIKNHSQVHFISLLIPLHIDIVLIHFCWKTADVSDTKHYRKIAYCHAIRIDRFEGRSDPIITTSVHISPIEDDKMISCDIRWDNGETCTSEVHWLENFWGLRNNDIDFRTVSGCVNIEIRFSVQPIIMETEFEFWLLNSSRRRFLGS